MTLNRAAIDAQMHKLGIGNYTKLCLLAGVNVQMLFEQFYYSEREIEQIEFVQALAAALQVNVIDIVTSPYLRYWRGEITAPKGYLYRDRPYLDYLRQHSTCEEENRYGT